MWSITSGRSCASLWNCCLSRVEEYWVIHLNSAIFFFSFSGVCVSNMIFIFFFFPFFWLFGSFWSRSSRSLSPPQIKSARDFLLPPCDAAWRRVDSFFFFLLFLWDLDELWRLKRLNKLLAALVRPSEKYQTLPNKATVICQESDKAAEDGSGNKNFRDQRGSHTRRERRSLEKVTAFSRERGGESH